MLLEVLRRFDPACRLLSFRPLEGGSSTAMSLLEVSCADGNRSRLVFRQCGPVNLEANPDSAETEFLLLNRLHACGLPVPRALLRGGSDTLFAIPWLLTDHCPGEPEWAPHDAMESARSMADFLVRLHALEPGDGFAFVPRQAIPDCPAATAASDPGLPRPDVLAARWPPRRANRARLLHGDFWAGNVLWQEDGISAVVDWEDAMIGDPLADLAVARSNLVWSHGPGPCRAFTSRYARSADCDLSQLWLWDLHAAWSMAPHAADYASGWQELGRPDITERTILEGLRQLVDEAMTQDLGRSFRGS